MPLLKLPSFAPSPPYRSLSSKCPFSQRSLQSTKRTVTTAAMNVIVKGVESTGTLLDCPFCHRVLLTLEEKKQPYTMTYVDLGNKPQWLFEKNAKGTVPILEKDGKIIPDSDLIVELLENEFPAPAMRGPDGAAALMASNKAMMEGRALAKAQDASEVKAKEEALYKELKALDDYLAAHGPLFGGENFVQADASLFPKLYHISVALPALKGWKLPAEFAALARYLDLVQQRESFKKTDYGREAIVAGWKKFLAGTH